MTAIEIKVMNDGTIRIEGCGIVGPGCTAMEEKFAEALGGRTQFEKTADFHKQPHVSQNQDQQAGA